MPETSQVISPSGYEGTTPRRSSVKKLRTRTGCWNCRRRRKKCDEQRPVCKNCAHKDVLCEWGLRLSFRPENIETIPASHPSLQKSARTERAYSTNIKIIDVTNEIIRDYWNDINTSSSENHNIPTPSKDRAGPWTPAYSSPGYAHLAETNTPVDRDILSSPSHPMTDIESHHASLGITSAFRSPDISISSPQSLDLAQSAAENLLDLGSSTRTAIRIPDTHDETPMLHVAFNEDQQTVDGSPASDGIFIPGSAYLEFHSALRNHTLHVTRSTFPSRCGTPDRLAVDHDQQETSEQCPDLALEREDVIDAASVEPEDTALSAVPTPSFVELSQQQEYELWKNWVDEIAPWLDKFDNQRQFGRTLPPIARDHPHLRFSILALSARQLERKDPTRSSLSLALYQEAIHHLVPQLQTRTTNVVASCVVLCVLEMMSCSPKMWRRHLDGCASMIQSMGINGLSGGLEQALFWCFVRMDVCGGFISDEQTIIPIHTWLPKSTLDGNSHLLYRSLGFDMYANYSVYLCGRVLDLLAGDHGGLGDNMVEYARRWSDLFDLLRKWYDDRPPEMKPVLDLSPSATDFRQPFPLLLFSSSSAISGNQLYHTGALLMLQQKPRGVRLGPGTRSILWHARRISAISISNTDHACWTNCVQPLWFAGRVMSHPAEHRAILEAYNLIERETGWGARWRADDLKEYWGDLGVD